MNPMVVPHVRDWPTVIAAAVSIGIFLLAQDLPYSTGLLPAAATGLLAGLISGTTNSQLASAIGCTVRVPSSIRIPREGSRSRD